MSMDQIHPLSHESKFSHTQNHAYSNIEVTMWRLAPNNVAVLVNVRSSVMVVYSYLSGRFETVN